ncbi:unnamed protein product, partial [Ectocarpus sp. 13 AM-2016]
PARLKGTLVATTTRGAPLTGKVYDKGAGPASAMWQTRFEDGSRKELSAASVRRGNTLYEKLAQGAELRDFITVMGD